MGQQEGTVTEEVLCKKPDFITVQRGGGGGGGGLLLFLNNSTTKKSKLYTLTVLYNWLW